MALTLGMDGARKLFFKFTITAIPHKGAPKGIAPKKIAAYERCLEKFIRFPPKTFEKILQQVTNIKVTYTAPAHYSPADSIACDPAYIYAPPARKLVIPDKPIVADDTEDLLAEGESAAPSAGPPSAGAVFDYQAEAIEYLSEQNICYFQMDTGLGKTRVGCGLIVAKGVATLVVVPTEAIAFQWLDEIKKCFPFLRAELFRNSAKVKPTALTHDVVVVIINTFRTKMPEFMEHFGLTILDEAHEYCSDVNSQALWLAQTESVIGLSATPAERPDGLDRYVNLHLGPVVYARDICDISSVNFKARVKVIKYKGDPQYCESVTTAAGTMSAIMTINKVIEDPARLQLVVSEILELRAAGHGVFVFSELREYVSRIQAELIARIQCGIEMQAEGVSVLRGGVAQGAVDDARKAGSHIVLTTYGFSRRGISLPEMTALVLATPRKNGMCQILGRILRRGSDESIVRQIVDICDVSTGLSGQLSTRKQTYKARGYPITEVLYCAQAAQTRPLRSGAADSPLRTAPQTRPADSTTTLSAEVSLLDQLSTSELLDLL